MNSWAVGNRVNIGPKGPLATIPKFSAMVSTGEQVLRDFPRRLPQHSLLLAGPIIRPPAQQTAPQPHQPPLATRAHTANGSAPAGADAQAASARLPARPDGAAAPGPRAVAPDPTGRRRHAPRAACDFALADRAAAGARRHPPRLQRHPSERRCPPAAPITGGHPHHRQSRHLRPDRRSPGPCLLMSDPPPPRTTRRRRAR